MEITNYQLQFCLFFFAGADIHLCNCSSSAFQAGITGTFLSAGHNLRLWRLLPFRQRLAGELKVLTAMDFCIQGCFWLEKPNFHNLSIYSEAWILVENLPVRQNIYLPRRRKDAKLNFRFCRRRHLSVHKQHKLRNLRRQGTAGSAFHL